MGELVLTTYDWVPDFPRGHVRDLRIRWALEEAGLPYRVESTPFKDRGPAHFAHQPFGQVPWLTDGDVSIFESGAILVYLGERHGVLLPTDPKARAEVQNWVFATLNSLEMVSVPWFVMSMSSEGKAGPIWDQFNGWLQLRLGQLEPLLAKDGWLVGDFSIADILLSDALRIIERLGGLTDHPACRAYIARAIARPAFQKAHADQLAHFARAD